jgi:hypothetical protein
MRAQRHLALAVREGISVEALRDYHLLIACGHAAQLHRDRDGEVSAVCVCCPPHGTGGAMRPTQDERTKSVNWLADRGHGLPAQSIYVDNIVRAETTQAIDLGALPPAALFAVLHALRGVAASSGGSASEHAPGLASADRGALPAGATGAVIDARATETAPAPPGPVDQHLPPLK